jgi:hypothetical protein
MEAAAPGLAAAETDPRKAQKAGAQAAPRPAFADQRARSYWPSLAMRCDKRETLRLAMFL